MNSVITKETRPGISIVVCCYNSAMRLPETLRYLAAQITPADLSWEIIIVDNASTDDTAELARSLWSETASAPLRIVDEPEPGLSHARRCGVREAQHEIISFIDDDNWLDVDWIARVHSVFSNHPEIAVCGGKSVAIFEIPSPLWFENLKGFYAAGSQHAHTGDITDNRGTLLWGAGLSLRTAAVRSLLDHNFAFILEDRKGAHLSTGGDTELCFALRAIGCRFWYDDSLCLQHFIPKERLRWDYALNLMRGMGKASVLFDLYLCALKIPPFDVYPAWKASWLFQLMKAVFHLTRLFLTHPGDCIYQSEGSSSALPCAMITGRLSMLISLRGRYTELTDQISHSDWNKTNSSSRT